MLGGGARRRWTREVGLLVAILVGAFTYVGTATTGDVVVNEVAWMGTEASSHDEWIELYNDTDVAIDLSDWSIFGADTGECLNVAAADGSTTTAIPAHDYLIYANGETDVQDGDGMSVVDIWDATIGLNNSSPGALILYDAPDCTGTAVDAVNEDGGDWPAGDDDTYTTMERVDPTRDGADDNWATNDGSARNGQDADGNSIHGTPKAVNSVTPTNTAPTCDDVSLTVEEGTSGSAAPECSDPDGDDLSYAIVDGPDHGTAEVADADLRYEPNDGFTGSDAFTYRADDGRATSDAAAVNVEVTATATEGDGDPDDDGTVDAIDARVCLRIARDLTSPPTEREAACDVDGDGDVDRDDVAGIARYAIGLTEDLGGAVWMAGIVLLGIGLALPVAGAARSARGGLVASLFVGLSTLLSGCPGLIPALPADAVGIQATVTSDAVYVEVQNMPNDGLAALEIADDGLTFNADVLRVTGVEAAEGWTVLAREIDNGSGEVRLVAVRPRGGTADGRVLTLPIDPKSGFSRGAADVAWDSKSLVLGDAANAEVTSFQTGTQP